MTATDISHVAIATCQKNAVAPTPVAIAIRVVCEAAQHRALQELHGRVSPETVVVHHDGSVEVHAAPSGSDADAARSKPAHLAPEQVTGSNVDRRADVFALGVILWELLAGTRLFARDTPGEVRLAITDEPVLDLRDVNPDVPELIAEVVRTALERNRAARFGTPSAFCNALGGAMRSSGVAEATAADVARWISECVPPMGSALEAGTGPASSSTRIEGAAKSAFAGAVARASAPPPPPAVPDLDVLGASRTHRSQAAMSAVNASSAAAGGGIVALPDLDLVAPSRASSSPSPQLSTRPSSPQLSAPPPAHVSAAPAAPAAPAAGGGRSIAFDTNDDDDFDMEIERNISGPMSGAPTATPSRASGLHAARTSGGHRPAGTGLELGAPSRMAREGSSERGSSQPISTVAKVAGYALSLAVLAGATVALLRYVHRRGGIDFRLIAPHAFDGSSATESLVVALGMVVAAVTVGFIGLRLKPHAWMIVAAAGVMLLLALAMVTVGLASSGENPTPPDGVLLVPYLLPASLALLALGVAGTAARTFARGGAARRVAAFPLAAIAGGVAFAAYELSRFAH